MSAGSCFAANVRKYLDAWGLDYVVTERPHPQWPEAAEASFYDAYSARYGNVYTARQMVQLLQRALRDFAPEEDHWVTPDGRFVDPFRPGITHRAYSLPELRALTAQHLRAVKRAVEAATVFVFTLGLTEAWVSASDGAVFPACPGTVAGEYDPERHCFVNFSIGEVTADLDAMIRMLRKINPKIAVIVTVSPVPLVATASGRHVLVATAYSKSVLRVAADDVARRHKDVAYFPAYEMVLGPQHRESPFADDLRTVREPAVAEVMHGFHSAYFDRVDTAPDPVDRQVAYELSDTVAAALTDDCEEMFADERLWHSERPKAARSRRQALDLESLALSAGPHAEDSGEFCVMEAAAHTAGEDWSDRPSSVSPLVGEILRSLNDAMCDGDRQTLKQVIHILPGSRGDGALEAARAWMAMDWHCRRWASTWLRQVGCADEGEALAKTGVIVDAETLRAALRALAIGRTAALAMRLQTTHESLEQGLDAAVAAAGANNEESAIVAARAAIQSDAGALVFREAQKEVPVLAGWTAKRRARWREACDIAMYKVSVAAGTAQIAAVRALSVTSAWKVGWNQYLGRVETLERACEDARSIGRDAALALAWRAAWAALLDVDRQASWAVATEAAEAVLRGPITGLQGTAVELVGALVDPNLALTESLEAHGAS